MVKVFKDSYSIWWADLRILRRLWLRFLITSLMSPVLYLLAFGFGLGRGINVGGASYLEFVIPGIIALTAMNTSFSGAGMKLNVDRLYYKCFDEIMMAPVSPFAVIFGKSLIGVLRGLVVSLAFLLLGLALSPMRVSPLFGLSLILTCFTFSFMGVLAALLARSHQDMATLSSVILRPMTFLGGTFFSLKNLPGWLKLILHLMPLTHSSRCLRAEALGRNFPWPSFLILLGFGVISFSACLLVLRRASL